MGAIVALTHEKSVTLLFCSKNNCRYLDCVASADFFSVEIYN